MFGLVPVVSTTVWLIHRYESKSSGRWAPLKGGPRTSLGLKKVLFTIKQVCLKLIHNTLWCDCLGSDHDGDKKRRERVGAPVALDVNL